MAKRTRKQNAPAPRKRSQPSVPTVRLQFHPGRRASAEEFIGALADPKSRSYATKSLDHIWWRKPAPSKPRGLSASRVKEIDAALLAIFSTVR